MRKSKTKSDRKISEQEAKTVDYFVNDDGSWIADTELGTVESDSDGKMKASFPDIKAISVGDLTSIAMHKIDESQDTVSHQIFFRNGGSCRLTYKKNGKVIEFKIGRAKLRVNFDKILIINPID